MLTGITIQDARGPLAGDMGTLGSRREREELDLLTEVGIHSDSTLELDDVRIGLSLPSDIEHWLELRGGHEGACE